MRAIEMRRAGIMRKLKVRSLAELLDLTITYQIHSDLRNAAGERQPSAPTLLSQIRLPRKLHS
jgi:hypothetical protein